MPGQGLLFFIILLGVLILVHELGHFLVAKLFKVQVFKFSFGFGPEILAFRIGETRYAISAIPLGGYVRMAGEEDLLERWGGPEAPQPDPNRLLNVKPLWQRALIIIAGPFANIVLAYVVFSSQAIGDSFVSPPIIGTILPGSPAERAQLRAGDRVLRIDSDAVEYFEDISALVSHRAGESIQLELQRGQEKIQVPVTLHSTTSEDELQQMVEKGRIGIGSYRRAAVVEVRDAQSLAARVGLRNLDRVRQINGKDIEVYDELEDALHDTTQWPLKVLVERRQVILQSPLRLSIPQLLVFELDKTATSTSAHLAQTASDQAIEVVTERKKSALAHTNDHAAATSSIQHTVKNLAQHSGSTHVQHQDEVELSGVAASDSQQHQDLVDARVKVYLDELDAAKIAATRAAAHSAIQEKKRSVAGILFADTCIGDVLAKSPAAALELARGDCLLALDGEEAHSWTDLSEKFALGKDQVVHTAVVSRHGSLRTVAFKLEKREEQAPLRRGTQSFVFGAQPVTPYLPGAQETITRNVPQAFAHGAVQTFNYVALTAKGLGLLLTLRIPFESVGGPIMMYDLAGRASERGFSSFVFLLAFISINLALLNLLPLPVLDGGHLLFFAIEAIQRRPPSRRVREIANMFGLALLLLLMVAVFRNDLSRYWSTWFN